MTALDAALADALDAAARVPVLLVALDFDGVLAPLVPVPGDARPLPRSAAAMAALTDCPGTTVATVSGRGLADLAAVSGFGPPVRLVGSHGGEFDDATGPPLTDAERARLERLTAAVLAVVDGVAGVGVEQKPAGVAVHVRNAVPEVGARVLDAVRTGPAAGPGIRATPGKEVLDLAVVDVDKGGAVTALRERLRADAVLFAGDDVTDETAFRRLAPGDVGIKVGDGDTAANHRVTDPEAVSALLEHLLAARRR